MHGAKEINRTIHNNVKSLVDYKARLGLRRGTHMPVSSSDEMDTKQKVGAPIRPSKRKMAASISPSNSKMAAPISPSTKPLVPKPRYEMRVFKEALKSSLEYLEMDKLPIFERRKSMKPPQADPRTSEDEAEMMKRRSEDEDSVSIWSGIYHPQVCRGRLHFVCLFD